MGCTINAMHRSPGYDRLQEEGGGGEGQAGSLLSQGIEALEPDPDAAIRRHEDMIREEEERELEERKKEMRELNSRTYALNQQAIENATNHAALARVFEQLRRDQAQEELRRNQAQVEQQTSTTSLLALVLNGEEGQGAMAGGQGTILSEPGEQSQDREQEGLLQPGADGSGHGNGGGGRKCILL